MDAKQHILGQLLDVDPTDPNAVRVGLAASGLSLANQRSANNQDRNYATSFETGFPFSTIPTGLTLTEEGTTTSAATYTGQATFTTDDVAAKSDQLATPLSWQVNKQVDKPLIFQATWKTGATIASNEFYLGFTDATNDTDPIALSSTSTFTTSVPTDCVVMGYSATPTSGAAFTTGGNQHVMIAINNDTNTIVGVGGGAFAAATFYTYRIEIDANGTARYYLNGQLLGTQASACRTTVPLCAIIWASPRTTASAAITVDSLGVYGAGVT